MNLLDHFYRLHKTQRGGLRAALALLNESLGTQYDVNRLAQWKRGQVPVPLPVQAYMRAIVLSDLQQAHQHRFTRAVLSEILEACEPPSAAAREVARPRSFFASCDGLPSQGLVESLD